MAEPPRLNAISCQRCKSKKLRCTRSVPTCDRCKTHDAECLYLPRTKKRRVRSSQWVDFSIQYRCPPQPSEYPLKSWPHNRTIENAVSSSILERLQKLENYCSKLADQTPPSSHSSPASAADHSLGTVCHPPSTHGDDNVGSTGPDPDATVVTFPVSNVDCSSGKGSPNTLPEPIIFEGNLLPDAVDETRRRVVRSLTECAVTETGVDVPSDTAKFWIENFLEFAQKENLSSLVDHALLRLLPDVIGLPHIHVDGTMTLIYYCALYHGAGLTRESYEGVKWGKKLYLCCIRALPGWQREATGSLTDFYAAILVAQVASEFFDRELAWQMFTLACRYAQGLQLHQVDRKDRPQTTIDGKPILDEHRVGIWNLIQTDLCYRLLHDKVPTLTANMDSWKVDLPKLSPSTEVDDTSAIQFLVSSRVTFALTEFFHIMSDFDNTDDADLMTKVEGICHQVDDLYSEWKIDTWVKSLGADMLRLWTVSSVAFTGYLCIIFMLRKATAKLYNLTDMNATDDLLWRIPLVQTVSLKMLDVAHVILKTDARFDVLCVLFGWFNIHLPYSYVAHRLIEESDAHADEGCITLLDDIAQIVQTATKANLEAAPLAPAFRAMNAQVQMKAMMVREQTDQGVST